jgi:hypothetical protein
MTKTQKQIEANWSAWREWRRAGKPYHIKRK